MADVFMAAITAGEVAAKLIKPGNTNTQVGGWITAGGVGMGQTYIYLFFHGAVFHPCVHFMARCR